MIKKGTNLVKEVRKLQFFSSTPEQEFEGCVGNQGKSLFRAIQSMQTSKSPQHSPALRARGAVSYHGFMHYAGRAACSLIRGKLRGKSTETAQEGCCEVNICLLCCSYLHFQGSSFCLMIFKSWRQAALCLIPR